MLEAIKPIQKKAVPKEEVFAADKAVSKILNKFVLLYNHLVHYHNIEYEEVIIRIPHLYVTIVPPESIIWYRVIEVTDLVSTDYLYSIDKIVRSYINTGHISKNSMEFSNQAWAWITGKAV